jgi:hypothetical protein
MRTDGRTDELTDKTKLIVAFRSCTNAPYKERWIWRDLTIFRSKQFPVIANTSFDMLHGPAQRVHEFTHHITHKIRSQHLAHISSSLVCPFTYLFPYIPLSLSRWPRFLRRRPASACLLRLRVRVSLGGMDLSLVNVVCCTGRRLCDGPIPR